MPSDRDPDHDEPKDYKASEGGRVDEPDATRAQEQGDRIETGKTIARGGKEKGHVPGADESR